MNHFTATEAGLEGFRVTRENPRAFARWSFFSFAVSVLGAVVTVNMPADIREALRSLNSEDAADIGTLLKTMIAAAPILGLGLIIQCMMAGAVYRIILRHDDARFGYLRLGADELRLVALTLIYFVMAVLFAAFASLVAALFAAGVMAVGGGAAISFAAIAELAVIAVMVFFAVRLSLAPVITFDQRKLAIFDSWRLTRGSFWKLFGAYVLAMACMVVIGILALVIFTMLAGAYTVATGGSLEDVGTVFNPDDTTLMSYLNPLMIAYMVMGSVLAALWYAVIAAPGAVAYQYLREHPPVPRGEARPA